MIIIIGGQSHTGKTMLAQKLMEKLHIPYLSLDHIKMGLYAGYPNCGFTPLDSDEIISEKLWPIIKGIINTCLENEQSLIIEGVYVCPNRAASLSRNNVKSFYIGFSQNYIEKNYDKIINFENVIEKRKFKEEWTEKEYIIQNKDLKEKCLEAGVKYFEINDDYEKEIETALKHIASNSGI